MKEQLMTLADVARLLDIKAHRINYAIVNGYVEEVQRIGSRRVFSAADVQRLAVHFGITTSEWETLPQREPTFPQHHSDTND